MRVQREASWWKDSEEQHYTVAKTTDGGEKQKSFSQIVTDCPQMISPTASNVPPKLKRNLPFEEERASNRLR